MTLASVAQGQATVAVDPLDPVYRDIALLVANRLVDSIIIGQRPYSRAVIARIVGEAESRLAQRSGRLSDGTLPGDERIELGMRERFLSDVVESLRDRFGAELAVARHDSLRLHFNQLKPVSTVGFDVLRSTAPTRAIRSNGLGEVDASVNPLVAYREGVPLGSGSSAMLWTAHTLQTGYLALSVEPRFFVRASQSPQDSLSLEQGDLRGLEARILYRNVALDIGREAVVWGQGRDVGLLGSTNSPLLDLIKLSNEHLFTLPWVFRRLGPTKLSLFYSDLGTSQNFPGAYLVGYKASVLPSPYVELGTAVYTKSGGKGSPPASLSSRLVDLLPFLDAGNYNNVFGTRGVWNASDHYMGLDGRLRFPALRGTEFGWEVLLNDFDVRRLGSVFWEDAGHVFQLTLPRLSDARRLSASVEYHHTGIRFYEHHQFTSGQTVRGMLLGDPLGPDAEGAYLELHLYANVRNRVALQGALERRSNDQYSSVWDRTLEFFRVESRPKEVRRRIVATWQTVPKRTSPGSLVQFGYEHTRNFDFAEGQAREGWLGRFGLEYLFW